MANINTIKRLKKTTKKKKTQNRQNVEEVTQKGQSLNFQRKFAKYQTLKLL